MGAEWSAERGEPGRVARLLLSARLGLPWHNQPQHFTASSDWVGAALWRVLAGTADRALGGPDAVLRTSDTALQKEGEQPPGVARICARQFDKRANRQALVRAPLARGAVPLLLALRLCPSRPPEAKAATRRKAEIALATSDRLPTSGVRSGTVIVARRR